ncbi:MAG: cupredoxin domain-containing protein [Thermoplasmatota archaeon]
MRIVFRGPSRWRGLVLGTLVASLVFSPLVAPVQASAYGALPGVAWETLSTQGYQIQYRWLSQPAVVDEANAIDYAVWGPHPPAFDSGALIHGQSFSATFYAPEVAPYFSPPQPFMKGNLTIADGTPAKPVTYYVSIANFAFSPQNLTIHVGDTVVWTNNDSTSHEVKEGSWQPLSSNAGLSSGRGAAQAAAGLYPMVGLSNWKVTVTYGSNESSPLNVTTGSAYGDYRVEVIPDQPGTYGLHFKGVVGTSSIDTKASLANETVLNRTPLEFPNKTLSNVGFLSRLQSDEEPASSGPTSSGGGLPAPGAIEVVGVLVVAVALLAWQRRR